MRVMLLLDKKPDGALPTSPDVMLDLSNPATEGINAMMQLQWRNRFKVLKSQTFYTGRGSLVTGTGLRYSGGIPDKYFSWYFNIPMKIDYAGDGAGLPMNRNLVLLCISDSTTADHPDISWTARVRYIDS